MQTRMTLTPTGRNPGPYETEVRSALITLEWKGWDDRQQDWVPYAGLDRRVVEDQYAPLVHSFSKTREWHEPKLKTCEEVGPGQWKVEVELPYLD